MDAAQLRRSATYGWFAAHVALAELPQALNSTAVQRGLKSILLNESRLWEILRGGQAA